MPALTNLPRFCAARALARHIAVAAVGWVVGSLAFAPAPARAHDVFTAYIQHNLHVTVGARHIDCTLDLTFFEEWSGTERGLMDSDRDGRISRLERETYLKDLPQRLGAQLRLLVGGQALELSPLYEPELDLLGTDVAGPAHHRLRLFFFATTPPQLARGDQLIIEDGLWPGAKALVAVRSEGKDSAELETEKAADPAVPALSPGEKRVFRIRILKPPGAASAD